MRALKGLLIYVGIVLGIILGIGVLLFGVMYFVPSFRIAGVGVVHSSDIVKDSIVDLAEYPTLTNYVLNVSSKFIMSKQKNNFKKPKNINQAAYKTVKFLMTILALTLIQKMKARTLIIHLEIQYLELLMI